MKSKHEVTDWTGQWGWAPEILCAGPEGPLSLLDQSELSVSRWMSVVRKRRLNLIPPTRDWTFKVNPINSFSSVVVFCCFSRSIVYICTIQQRNFRWFLLHSWGGIDPQWQILKVVSVSHSVSIRRAVQQCFPLHFNQHVTPKQTTPQRNMLRLVVTI